MNLNIIKNIFNLTKKKDHNYKHVCIKILGIKFSFKYKLVDRYEIADKSNKIYIKENGILREAEKKVPGLEIEVSGSNNTIIIELPTCFINSHIVCNGNNGEIIIEKTNKKFIDLLIYMSSNFNERPLRNRKVHIKSNASTNGGGGISIFSWSENSKVLIGEDSMFSFGIKIMCGDGHLFKDKNTGEYINNYDGCFVEIGNHCWVGMNSIICKNTKIANGCIIGAGSVVTKSCEVENCVIAGNPAKVVKKNVEWQRQILLPD